MPLKFGRKPAVHNMQTMRSALAMARHLDPLGTPPTHSADWPAAVDAVTGGDWGMFANDQVGDCTMADGCHQIMVHTANASTLLTPTAQDALDAYSALTGFDPSQTAPDGSNPTDNGAAELDVCQYMQTTGICGHKSDGYGSIDPRNYNHIKWCVQLFGACRLGFTVVQSAMDQFDAGQPWDYVGDNTPVGGHDVPIVKYDASYYYVVTWGKLQPVTQRFLGHYLDEAHQELYADWIRQAGTAPNNFNLQSLLRDLKLV